MSDVNTLLLNIYSTLLEIRYPAITKAEPSNIDSTILSGKNRISLLSWLLSEKSQQIGDVLKTLEGSALEEQLVKYYSELGISAKKDILLGKCSIKEQLPILRLLLEFMRCVHMETYNTLPDSEDKIEQILEGIVNTNSVLNSPCHNVTPRLSYSDASQYFETIKNDLKSNETEYSSSPSATTKEYIMQMKGDKEINTANFDTQFSIEYENFVKSLSSIESDIVPNMKSAEYVRSSMDQDFNNLAENLADVKHDVTNVNTVNLHTQFIADCECFLKAFSSIGLHSMSNTKCTENQVCCMDEDISKLAKNLSSLKQVLQIKDKVLKSNIPEGISKCNTPFDKVIQDVVMCIDKGGFTEL